MSLSSIHTINVPNLIGTRNAILHPYGMQVYQKALESLRQNEKVEIDLTDLETAISAFFHASLGNLFRELGELYFQKILLKGLENHPTWEEKIQDVLDSIRNPRRATETELAIASLFEE